MTTADTAGRQRRRWRDLPREERQAVLTMLWLVPVMHVAVRLFNYRALRRWLERLTPAPSQLQNRPAPEATIDALRLATSRVAVHSWLPGNCLSRSLALWWLLQRKAIDADIRLGVNTAEGVFAAHAWVESHGLVINDHQKIGDHYRPLR
jgi:hypothetical protein